MQPMLTEQTVLAPTPRGRSFSTVAAPASPGARRLDRDQQFLHLLAGFRRSGGLIRAQEVSTWLEAGASHQAGTLSRWMAHNDVVHFNWQFRTWLPMFQFDVATMAPRVAVGLILIELHGSFDNWRIAQWFSSPNATLQGRNPADVLGADPARAIEAARVDRSRVDA